MYRTFIIILYRKLYNKLDLKTIIVLLQQMLFLLCRSISNLLYRSSAHMRVFSTEKDFFFWKKLTVITINRSGFKVLFQKWIKSKTNKKYLNCKQGYNSKEDHWFIAAINHTWHSVTLGTIPHNALSCSALGWWTLSFQSFNALCLFSLFILVLRLC